MQRSRSEPQVSRWAWATPLLGLAVALVVMLLDPLVLQGVRNATFDQFQRWQPRAYGEASVKIIDIDDESLHRVGQWPWPRDRVAQLINEIDQLAPASTALDMVFAEPDRTSPRSLLHGTAVPASTAAYLEQLPDHDDVLASALADGRVAIGVALTPGSDVARSSATDDAVQVKAGYVLRGGDPGAFVPAFSSAVASLPNLQHAAAGQGAMTFIPDVDGIVRQVPLLMSLNGHLVPSLAAEALRLAGKGSQYTVRSAGHDGGVVGVEIAGRAIATDAGGSVWVHYARPQPQRYIPAWKVLAHDVPADALKGRVVLVGTSAQGLMDLRFSPRGGIIPGVEVHAQALEQMLAGDHLGRPGWALALELIVTLLAGAGMAWVAMRWGAAVSTAAFALVCVTLWLGGWVAYTRAEWLLDPATPTLAMALVFVPATILRYLLGERRQRWVKQAFARYVSPNLVDYLIAHPGALELGGKRQRCSFVFADLAGFTTLMETMDPAAAVRVLNAYLDRMIAIAFEHEGTLDRIVGDAVAIVFSAPIEQADHEQRALRCAMQMHAFARQYVADLAHEGIAFCDTRIGVHSGEVTVGNFGGNTIFDYRALGDPVNTAARLEGANKYFGTLICVSEATLCACSGVCARPIGRVRLAGRSELLMVHEPLPSAALELGGDPDYGRAYDLLRASDPAALAAFSALADRRPQDPLVSLHLRRLRAGHVDDTIELLRK